MTSEAACQGLWDTLQKIDEALFALRAAAQLADAPGPVSYQARDDQFRLMRFLIARPGSLEAKPAISHVAASDAHGFRLSMAFPRQTADSSKFPRTMWNTASPTSRMSASSGTSSPARYGAAFSSSPRFS